MKLTASDIVSLYRPEPCQLRVYLREHHAAEAEPGAYDEIIERLGRLHEQNHLASLGAYEDISAVEPEQQAARTLEAIRTRVPVIYQGEFRVPSHNRRNPRRSRWASRLPHSRRTTTTSSAIQSFPVRSMRSTTRKSFFKFNCTAGCMNAPWA